MSTAGGHDMMAAIVSHSVEDSPGSKIRRLQESAKPKPTDPQALLESVAERLAYLTSNGSMPDGVRAELSQIVDYIRGK